MMNDDIIQDIEHRLRNHLNVDDYVDEYRDAILDIACSLGDIDTYSSLLIHPDINHLKMATQSGYVFMIEFVLYMLDDEVDIPYQELLSIADNNGNILAKNFINKILLK